VARPLWRRTRRPRRFVWQRITPGELGLEMTTLFAVLLVGLFTYAGLAVTLEGSRLTTGDARTLNLVADLQASVAVDVAEVLTYAGSLSAVVLAVLATSGVLLWRKQGIEAATIVVGQALIYGAVHAAKAIEERPRPAGGLVESAGYSFPSGHAAYGVTWVAIAVVLGRAPGLARGATLVVLAVVLAAAIGATRIYLRVHYLSDVLAGAGLAAAIYAVCGMAALVVAHLRHNPRSSE
jgi:undecaprenyl-diphosphatase